MKKQHVLAIAILSLVVISGAIFISACASIASARPQDNFSAQVNTAAAATLVQYMIETQVATMSVAMLPESEIQAQATQVPTATSTPVPTATTQPTVVPTVAQPTAVPTTVPTAPQAPAAAQVSGPKIRADLNTNCRAGPSTRYTILTTFMQGAESTVQGIDSGKNWWYIANPTQPSASCWVWEGSTTVIGDTSTLPVVAAPAITYPDYNQNLFYGYNPSGYFDGCGYNYSNYCANNCWKQGNCWKNNCCKPNKKACNQNKWWYCNQQNYTNYCGCGVDFVFQNPCKKSNCPPLTIVNYQNYCQNYPKCCDID